MAFLATDSHTTKGRLMARVLSGGEGRGIDNCAAAIARGFVCAGCGIAWDVWDSPPPPPPCPLTYALLCLADGTAAGPSSPRGHHGSPCHLRDTAFRGAALLSLDRTGAAYLRVAAHAGA